MTHRIYEGNCNLSDGPLLFSLCWNGNFRLPLYVRKLPIKCYVNSLSLSLYRRVVMAQGMITTKPLDSEPGGYWPASSFLWPPHLHRSIYIIIFKAQLTTSNSSPQKFFCYKHRMDAFLLIEEICWHELCCMYVDVTLKWKTHLHVDLTRRSWDRNYL